MLLPTAHRKLGTAAMFTPIGIGVTLGPFMAGALVDASGVNYSNQTLQQNKENKKEKKKKRTLHSLTP
jgi:hypothetical protein